MATKKAAKKKTSKSTKKKPKKDEDKEKNYFSTRGIVLPGPGRSGGFGSR